MICSRCQGYGWYLVYEDLGEPPYLTEICNQTDCEDCGGTGDMPDKIDSRQYYIAAAKLIIEDMLKKAKEKDMKEKREIEVYLCATFPESEVTVETVRMFFEEIMKSFTHWRASEVRLSIDERTSKTS